MDLSADIKQIFIFISNGCKLFLMKINAFASQISLDFRARLLAIFLWPSGNTIGAARVSERFFVYLFSRLRPSNHNRAPAHVLTVGAQCIFCIFGIAKS